MDQKELIEKIAGEVMKKLKAEMGDKAAEVVPGQGGPPPASLAKYIDHTMLRPEAPDAAFDQLCDEAVEWGFYAVCVNSSRVRYVAKRLQGKDVKVAAVVGFPLGDFSNAVVRGGEAIVLGIVWGLVGYALLSARSAVAEPVAEGPPRVG